MTARERGARAALSAVVEPGTVAVARRLLAEGAEATWQAIRRGDRRLDRHGVLERRAREVDGAEVLAHADGIGVRYICPGDDEWPVSFATMPDTVHAGADVVAPPFGLWARGERPVGECSPAVAIVGARAATPYGMRVAADLGTDLALQGWTVVSGAAYGIDAAAHRGALGVGGCTVAVLACGLDMVYPRGHNELLDRIRAGGVVLSELAPGMAPMRSRFLARNRLIAALTAGTVVVEAARRSGALNTAHWSVKLGREVAAVPGPATSALSSGCHEWIRDRGATLVTGADEVIELLCGLGSDAAVPAPVPDRPLDRFSPVVQHVYEQLPAFGALPAEELSRASGYPGETVRAALAELATAGLVRDEPTGWARVPGAARADTR